jgi:DUF971 family protein
MRSRRVEDLAGDAKSRSTAAKFGENALSDRGDRQLVAIRRTYDVANIPPKGETEVTMAAMVAPTVIGCEVSPDLASLSLTTSDRRQLVFAAETLRGACKCAHCTRARFDGRFPQRFPAIAIVEVTDLGYGLNISFSDGHNRGIYPKVYLLSLAEG